MDAINRIVKKAQDKLFPELEAKIRLELEQKDKDWLIDQIIYLTCQRHGLSEQQHQLAIAKKRNTRIRKKGYDITSLTDFISTYRNISRKELEGMGFLINPPHMGLAMIGDAERSKKGEALLEEARDVLYAALYGDEAINVHLTRVQEEVLTMMLPVTKSDALFFLKAVTTVDVIGTWKDEEGISNDDQVQNTEFQVEYGDAHKGMIGSAIFVALRLINLLHVNEQVFYARTENVERSSLQML